MHNKKVIVCKTCHYFPTKADHIKNKEILIEPTKITWQCQVCNTSSIYHNRQTIVLPESCCEKISKCNILRTIQQGEDYHFLIIIDCDGEMMNKPAYTVPKNIKAIQEHCHVSLTDLKTRKYLQAESQWFAAYEQRSKSINKFAKHSRINNQRVVLIKDYLIYLIEGYINKQKQKNNQIPRKFQTKIVLIKQNDKYFFNFDSNHSGDQLNQFLQIYSLLQIQTPNSWLQNLYKDLIEKHKKQFVITLRLGFVLLVGDKFTLQEQTLHRMTTKLGLQIDLDKLTKSKNILILSSIDQQNQHFRNFYPSATSFEKSTDKITVFFKVKSQPGIKKMPLDAKEVEDVRECLLQQANIDQPKLISVISLIAKQKLNLLKIKPLKLYSELTTTEPSIVMYVFNWQQIEKDLFIEQLDQESQYDHILKQDVLEEVYPRKQPNPFSKKKCNYYELEQQQQDINDQDYICL